MLVADAEVIALSSSANFHTLQKIWIPRPPSPAAHSIPPESVPEPRPEGEEGTGRDSDSRCGRAQRWMLPSYDPPASRSPLRLLHGC